MLKNDNVSNHKVWIFILLGGNSLYTRNLINNYLQVLAKYIEPIFKVPKGFLNLYLDFFQHIVANKICHTNIGLKKR